MTPLFYISAFLGLTIFVLLLTFLATTLYHLSQYRLPGQSLKTSVPVLLAVSLLLLVCGAALFFISFWGLETYASGL